MGYAYHRHTKYCNMLTQQQLGVPPELIRRASCVEIWPSESNYMCPNILPIYCQESGWKHKNLPELASDGRTEETGFSWKSWIWLVKQILSTVCDENLTWRGSIWDSFPHSGLPWGAMGDRFFRKEFGKSGSQKSKKSKKSKDWPDLDPEPIFLDFVTIVLVRKAPRTRLNTSRGPKTL